MVEAQGYVIYSNTTHYFWCLTDRTFHIIFPHYPVPTKFRLIPVPNTMDGEQNPYYFTRPLYLAGLKRFCNSNEVGLYRVLIKKTEMTVHVNLNIMSFITLQSRCCCDFVGCIWSDLDDLTLKSDQIKVLINNLMYLSFVFIDVWFGFCLLEFDFNPKMIIHRWIA